MAHDTKIKICGIRRAEDCAYINEAMPDYAGFIFWDRSLRYVDEENAARLRRLIDPRIITVGVFVDEEPERIAGIVSAGTISVVQLHGSEDEQYVSGLRSLLPPRTKVWKAFKIRSIDDIRTAMSFDADRILLDNGYGTGQCFDHGLLDAVSLAADAGVSDAGIGIAAGADAEVPDDDTCNAGAENDGAVSAAGASMCGKSTGDAENVIGGRIYGTKKTRHTEYILAGGLTPDNIGEAIAKYHPYMIDISSGVETDGCKDRDKIMRAAAACRSSI